MGIKEIEKKRIKNEEKGRETIKRRKEKVTKKRNIEK